MTPSAYWPSLFLEREASRSPVLHRDEPDAQRADVLAARQLRLLQHLRPGIDRVAGKAGRDVPAAVDGGEVEGVVRAR